ncbi:Uncharacterised protein [Bordetella parapertussis]|nr:Uncharacterised protein [Bordetella parapertussis]SUV60268.1 Uncharacterised protein [Bordetella parapertussis]SUV81437.1 Uncharacterised protein [Bordetella parapertussis]VEF51780.1 Uncharacterised protein [Bordetella parapertussis]VTR43419.1 Uncharacterised protein [Bordetella parapertussis]
MLVWERRCRPWVPGTRRAGRRSGAGRCGGSQAPGSAAVVVVGVEETVPAWMPGTRCDGRCEQRGVCGGCLARGWRQGARHPPRRAAQWRGPVWREPGTRVRCGRGCWRGRDGACMGARHPLRWPLRAARCMRRVPGTWVAARCQAPAAQGSAVARAGVAGARHPGPLRSWLLAWKRRCLHGCQAPRRGTRAQAGSLGPGAVSVPLAGRGRRCRGRLRAVRPRRRRGRRFR